MNAILATLGCIVFVIVLLLLGRLVAKRDAETLARMDPSDERYERYSHGDFL